jgi:hypothetical protein
MFNCGLHKPPAILWFCNVPGNNQNVWRAAIPLALAATSCRLPTILATSASLAPFFAYW